MAERLNNISNAAVAHATSRTWEDWINLLDTLGASTMTHREIVRMLHEKKRLANSWWCQMVANGYEKARGRRVLGQTADAGFQIGVTKTLPITPRDAWRTLTSPCGLKLWLGDAPRIVLKKGEEYKTRSGICGEFRPIKRGQRLRLTYQPRGASSPTTLQVTITPRQSTRGTCIRFHREKLRRAKEREQMRRHWRQVLETFSLAVGGRANQ